MVAVHAGCYGDFIKALGFTVLNLYGYGARETIITMVSEINFHEWKLIKKSLFVYKYPQF